MEQATRKHRSVTNVYPPGGRADVTPPPRGALLTIPTHMVIRRDPHSI
jgi:hypothetical protein